MTGGGARIVHESGVPADVLANNPHLQTYLEKLEEAPQWIPVLDRSLRDQKPYNFLYPVGDPVFIHLIDDGNLYPKYNQVEPILEGRAAALREHLENVLFLEAAKERPEGGSDNRARRVEEILTTADIPRKLRSNPHDLEAVRYHIVRDRAGDGPLEPIIRDPWIEDIHGLGEKPIHVVHKIFETVETGIQFPTSLALDAHLEDLSRRMGRPVSATTPIVDGALPDGSRINIIYGERVSRGGSSFTIRKFSERPLPVSQLAAWNTFDARIAAYLWLCLEHGMSVFVSGETASGKTTTLNALLPFIPPRSKILTAEDTPEVLPPHENWQQLVTRDRVGGGGVEMQDLLRAGLRSRPDVIIVGEIRGVEGNVAFQAMQAGHATMATFHASSVSKLIQRFTGDPIRVPVQFMGNLNVVLIQMAVYVKGRILRRVLAVEEIEGYSKRAKQTVTRQVFRWDPNRDEHLFSGRYNSHVLENLVAPALGLADPRDIYKELERRRQFIQDLMDNEIFDPDEVRLRLSQSGIGQ